MVPPNFCTEGPSPLPNKNKTTTTQTTGVQKGNSKVWNRLVTGSGGEERGRLIIEDDVHRMP
jgi:hypothetical protein